MYIILSVAIYFALMFVLNFQTLMNVRLELTSVTLTPSVSTPLAATNASATRDSREMELFATVSVILPHRNYFNKAS